MGVGRAHGVVAGSQALQSTCRYSSYDVAVVSIQSVIGSDVVEFEGLISFEDVCVCGL